MRAGKVWAAGSWRMAGGTRCPQAFSLAEGPPGRAAIHSTTRARTNSSRQFGQMPCVVLGVPAGGGGSGSRSGREIPHQAHTWIQVGKGSGPAGIASLSPPAGLCHGAGPVHADPARENPGRYASHAAQADAIGQAGDKAIFPVDNAVFRVGFLWNGCGHPRGGRFTGASGRTTSLLAEQET